MRIVLQLIENINRKDLDGINSLLSDDCTYEGFSENSADKFIEGKNLVAQNFARIFSKYDSFHIETEEIYNMGFQCVIRYKIIWGKSTEMHERRCVAICHVRTSLLSSIMIYAKI